jgi:Bromodomain/TAZ zinc finger
MAKRLEEHLYRSAQTKEEYLDSSTLKKRLQLIAHGLESHRTTSGGSTDEPKASSSPAPLPLQSGQSGTIGASSAGGGTSDASSKLQLQMQLAQLQQLQQLQQQQQQKLGGVNKGLMDNLNPMMLKQSGLTQEDMFREQAKQLSAQQGSLSGASASGYPSVFGQAGSQMTAAQLQDSILKAQQSQSSAKLPTMSRRASSEATAGILKNSSKYQDPQKRKVIKQQQQRLLLLRHASKCKNGPNCKVKFCGQMVQLWKHMKKCRDKNCKTAHCLSSRCVLNHYRICKSENKTSSCEVCGPVMRQIKQQQNSEKQDDLEPLPASKDDLILSDPDLLPGTVVAPDMARQGSKSAVQIQSADEALAAQTLNQIDLQAAQLKLQQQTMLLKQLQQQQAELMEQQQRLQQQQQHVLPQTQQGQQLQQQQALLQQLQQQFQQQQLLLQQELIRQSQALQSGQAAAAQLSQLSQGEQMSQVSQLSQIPAGGLDLGPDGKPKKRAAAAPRRVSKKSLERQLSGLGKQAKQVRGRGSGKGKRFSDLESQICGDDHSSVQSSDFVSSGVKRSAGDLVGSIGMEDLIDEPPTKAIKLERVHSGSILDPTIPENRVLEQGDCDHTTSLVPSMPQEAIEQHLASLQNGMHMTPRAISSKCLPVIRRMLDDQFGWVFRDPVDPVVLGLPDYFDVVKNPMHLALIEQNVENGVYRDMATFERDTKLVFENAILYNGEESEVGEMAKTMLTNFAMDFTGVVDGTSSDMINCVLWKCFVSYP